jgi:hypothetical protein
MNMRLFFNLRRDGDKLILVGTSEEMDALGDMLKLKAKMGKNYGATYTGIQEGKLEVLLVEEYQRLTSAGEEDSDGA